MTKSLLELAKDLEYLASDMKKSNDEFFSNIFNFAGDIRDKSQEVSGLAPENTPIEEKDAEEVLPEDPDDHELDADTLTDNNG